MSALQLAVAVSLAIIAFGIGALALLLFKYRERLLKNFGQKIRMTLSLGIIFISLFILGNFLLADWIKSSVDPSNLPYLKHPWVLIRFALAFFVLNSFLILAFRSLIKVVSKL